MALKKYPFNSTPKTSSNQCVLFKHLFVSFWKKKIIGKSEKRSHRKWNQSAATTAIVTSISFFIKHGAVWHTRAVISSWQLIDIEQPALLLFKFEARQMAQSSFQYFTKKVIKKAIMMILNFHFSCPKKTWIIEKSEHC